MPEPIQSGAQKQEILPSANPEPSTQNTRPTQNTRSPWQPIETAPKDGTTIDLWINGRRWPDCFWGKPDHDCAEAGQYCDSDWHRAEPGWVDQIFPDFISGKPSHWMLAPDGPSVPAGNAAKAAQSKPKSSVSGQPSKGALRAAEKLILAHDGLSIGGVPCSRMAAIIDSETGLPELLEALKASRSELLSLSLALGGRKGDWPAMSQIEAALSRA